MNRYEKNRKSEVLACFVANVCLKRYLDIVNQCAEEIRKMQTNDFFIGDYEIPADEMKCRAGEKSDRNCDVADLIEKAPLDLSGLEDEKLEELLDRIEEALDAGTSVFGRTICKFEHLKKKVQGYRENTG